MGREKGKPGCLLRRPGILKTMIDVCAMGELLIDFATVEADEKGYPLLKANPGGAPCNYLAALTKFGLHTGFIGKVGADIFGDLLIETLGETGIETRGIVKDPEAFTTLAFVTFDKSGDRHFGFARKPGADTCLRFEECDLSLIDEAKVFHFGTLSLTDEPSRTATKELVKYARGKEKLISFDPNLRKPLWKDMEQAKAEIGWGLSMADIIKISDEEVEFMYGLSPEEGACHILSETDAKLVFVTLGPDGVYFLHRNGACGKATCPRVEPVDTTGAGDIFFGSAMSRILKSDTEPGSLTAEELYDIASFASASASLSTERQGGISSVRDEAEILARMA